MAGVFTGNTITRKTLRHITMAAKGRGIAGDVSGSDRSTSPPRKQRNQ